MDNRAHPSSLPGYSGAESAGNSNYSTSHDSYVSQPTSNKWPAIGGPDTATEGGAHVSGRAVRSTAVIDRSGQVPEPHRTTTNSTLPPSAQPQPLDPCLYSIDQILQESYEQPFADFQNPILDATPPPNLPFKTFSSPDQSTNKEYVRAPAGQSQHPPSLSNLNTTIFDPMPEKRRSYGQLQHQGTSDPRFDYHTPLEPPPKRQRIKTPLENHASVEASTRSSLSYPGSKPHTTLLCGLWVLRNPGKKPTEQTKQELSDICDEKDPYVVDSIFAASERANNDQHTPNIITEAACELWMLDHPSEEPARWQKTMLSGLYGGSPKSVSNYFTRKQENPPSFNDSGHGTMTQTITSKDAEMISRWRCNRRKCHLKRDLQSNLRKDNTKKYMCTSLCGTTFDAKDNWKKHERNNRMQDLWPCDYTKCRQNTEDNIWSRKEELLSHVKTRHKDPVALYKPRCIKIPANVRGECLWRNCTTSFKDFNEFLGHMLEHFDNDWTAADLRGWEEETDAPLIPQPAQNVNQGPDLRDSDDEDEGPPPPNAGAGPSSGHQASPGYGPGPGNPESGSGNSAPDNSETGRSSALGNNPTTRSSNGMRLKNLSPSAKQGWRQMASWSPRLDFLGRLGSGATAVVDEVSIAGVSGTLACKTFAAQWCAELIQELQTMSRLRHPHIVALFHAYFRAGCTSILMQPVADYNLSQYLAKCTFTPTEQCNMWLWFSCLTSGLHHMHEHGVLHHDIKPSNILVMDKMIFYSDFGSSASMATDQAHNCSKWGFTRVYAAPEVFHGDRRTASDIFSLGCVFLEMITVLVSKDLRQQLHALQAQSYQQNCTSLHWASNWNSRLWALSKHQMTGSKVRNLLQICQTMTDPQPDQRPSAAEIDRRLNPQVCRPCSFSTEWRAKKVSTWPLDQPSLNSLRGLHMPEGELAKAKESIPSRIEELSQASQGLDQLSLKDASESGAEQSLPETGENRTIKRVRFNHETKLVRSMMTNYLMDQDPCEKFRASGEAVLPKILNAVGLPSQYPFYINI